jgi:DNA-binding MarR family transcriptional regulator
MRAEADPERLNLGLLLYIPYRHLEDRVFTALADAGFDDVTPAQARVFQRIAEGGSRLTDLAEQARITKQSAGFLVDQLERAGYVVRVPDPTDRRARLVQVAQRGREAVRVSATAVAAVEGEWAELLGESGADRLRALLEELREATDPYLRR